MLLEGNNEIINLPFLLLFFCGLFFFFTRGMENLVSGSNLPPLFTDEDGSKEGSEITVTG